MTPMTLTWSIWLPSSVSVHTRLKRSGLSTMSSARNTITAGLMRPPSACTHPRKAWAPNPPITGPKGELRVAVERDVDTGSFVTKGAGYLHAKCALEHEGDAIDVFFDKLKANSSSLEAADLDTLKAELSS